MAASSCPSTIPANECKAAALLSWSSVLLRWALSLPLGQGSSDVEAQSKHRITPKTLVPDSRIETAPRLRVGMLNNEFVAFALSKKGESQCNRGKLRPSKVSAGSVPGGTMTLEF
ncbi:hypothetical protein TWF694_000484 [Orbilia ellipsospora]|uniref:Secreted protein n=1 Tax=Orbilia ellipsospora TaxID=2528407 RepID=A0AAV9XP69_9PEZI